MAVPLSVGWEYAAAILEEQFIYVFLSVKTQEKNNSSCLIEQRLKAHLKLFKLSFKLTWLLTSEGHLLDWVSVLRTHCRKVK